MAHTVMAFAAEEPGQFAAQHEMDCTDRLISTCYRLIRSFEPAICDEQRSEFISQETPPKTLSDIADRVFTLGWNTNDLTCLQRAQVLNILLSVADLAARVRRLP